MILPMNPAVGPTAGGFLGTRRRLRRAAPALAVLLPATLAAVRGQPPASQPSPGAAGLPSAADRAEAIRAAVRRVAPSIVTIETVGGAQPVAESAGASSAPTRPAPRQVPPGGRPRGGHPGFRVADGPTTGLIWSADGWIVSSSFNFVRNPIITTVVVPSPAIQPDGRESPPARYVARLVARDYIRRLALLKIDAADLPAPAWAPAGEIRPGQSAIACGRGLGAWLSPRDAADAVPAWFPSVSFGIISAVNRRNGNAVQTDARTSPVNYGGPLIDLQGRVLGLIVPLAGAGGEMAGLEWYDSGIGFAVTRESIERVVMRLMRGESIEAGRMGVTIADAEDGRCRVQKVSDPSPAQSAGVQEGDIIVEFNGQAVGDRAELLRRISDQAAGERVTVGIERSGKTLKIEMTLVRAADLGEARPDDEPPATQPASGPDDNPDK